MVKLRKIASIERGIEEILQALTEQEIKETIGKGASYLRKNVVIQIETLKGKIQKE